MDTAEGVSQVRDEADASGVSNKKTDTPGTSPVAERSDKADAIFRTAVDHFFVTYLGLWFQRSPKKKEETIAVTSILIAAMLDVAMRVAVDLGMSITKLEDILRESYERAVKKAPKWGP